VIGAPKGFEADYDAPFERVWVACVRAAGLKFALDASDKASGVFTFKTGTTWRSWGLNVSVVLTRLSEEKTRVSLRAHKKAQVYAWKEGDRVAMEFFKSVSEELDLQRRTQEK